MKIAFIGDIVGRTGRLAIKKHLKGLREEYKIDFVIANYENASHGFGLTRKNCDELLSYGIDMMSGGNHSFDKKEILDMFDEYPLIRPLNYPKDTVGSGVFKTQILGRDVAILNLMGYYTMPMVDNPFTMVRDMVDRLRDEGYRDIILDFHAESSAEKNIVFQMLKQDISAIFGTHTHIGTDDLTIDSGCCYVTDVGLTGCRDGVIGMKSGTPILNSFNGAKKHFDIDEKCATILQMIIFELDDMGRCVEAQKIKIYDDRRVITNAWRED